MPGRIRSLLTPRIIAAVARLGAVATVLMLGGAYALAPGAVPLIGTLCYLLAILLLLSFPDVRSNDLATVAAILATTAELASGASGDRVDGFRWLVALAAIGAAILPLRAQRIRMLERLHPYRPFSEYERRHGRSSEPATTLRPARRRQGEAAQVLLSAPAPAQAAASRSE